MKQMSRLTIDIPKEEHVYLKMACAKLGTSMKAFLLKLALEKMEELEDEWLAIKADKRLQEMKPSDLIEFQEAIKLVGWNNVE